MISKWDDFKRINESINPYAMKICGYYRANEHQLVSMTIDFLVNDILFDWKDYDNKVLVVETHQFEKPYNIILKNGGEKLPFDLENSDYEHNCVLLKSKPSTCPPGAYM
jgi:hypothetical protein